MPNNALYYGAADASTAMPAQPHYKEHEHTCSTHHGTGLCIGCLTWHLMGLFRYRRDGGGYRNPGQSSLLVRAEQQPPELAPTCSLSPGVEHLDLTSNAQQTPLHHQRCPPSRQLKLPRSSRLWTTLTLKTSTATSICPHPRHGSPPFPAPTGYGQAYADSLQGW